MIRVRSVSLEHRVERLESHFESLDNAVHRFVQITGETQKIVLENHRKNRLMFAQVEKRFDQQDHKIEAYQSENCKHFDKI
ncbi:hypothetical protein [Endozoicomonas sp. 2B-B]